MNLKTIVIFYSTLFSLVFLTNCQTTARVRASDPVNIPFIKNSANECYYLDEFMPVPDGMVTGKSGILSLRYYSYKAANYKNWSEKYIILSFYSNDDRCWSLFEEYYRADI